MEATTWLPARPFKVGLWFRRVVLVGFVGGFAWLWFLWPPPGWYRWFWPGETAFMRLREGPRHYQPVALEAIARHLPDAVLAGEDERFYTHGGIDYVELRHALGYRPDSFAWTRSRDRELLWRALQRSWERRGRVRGASTITQQLAKNLYLSPSRNPLRKLKEAVTAWRLEYWLGKRRILELYLNTAELGPGIWGVEAASREYFGRGAGQLTLEQAAALAGALPFPLSSNPAHRPGRMRWRQNMILRKLRGEEVEIPRVLDTLELPPIPDSLPMPLPPDTLPDTLRIPPDTLRAGAVRGRVSPPGAGA